VSPADAPAGPVWAAIPARYESARFPGKPLAPIRGKAMIQHVYERAQRVPSVARVLVASDDARITEAVRRFGGEAVPTGEHPTGTDRIAEAVRKATGDSGAAPGWVLNVQGDEPLIDPEDLETLVKGVGQAPEGMMGTLVYPLRNEEGLNDPLVVKSVLDEQGRARYFSRSPVTHPRGKGALGWRHIGVYLFRTDFLYTFAGMEMTPLARREELEQLRALEHGYPIHCFEARSFGVGVDVPEDIPRVEALLDASQRPPTA
jgi:3-deoxy-manno-octulosonate cytidylyltransferase (CMP-KDO synthetase)